MTCTKTCNVLIVLNNHNKKWRFLVAPEHIGTFLNQPIPDRREPEPERPDTERLKDLAALMSQRSHAAREVLNVLVDRLLEDTDALLRKGFSLDDVLGNLSEKAAMERERTALEQTLEKLLNERHV